LNAAAAASVTLLLPPAARLGGTLVAGLAKALARADRLPPTVAGERAQLLRHFDIVPCGWPAAAITRQADVGDADGACWLRVDPAWIRPEMTGARLFGWGRGVKVGVADIDAFLPALRPVFDDAGFVLDAPTHDRWYLRLPRDTWVPAFTDPADALGADIFDYLPQSEAGVDNAQVRRWRGLLNDIQIVLHTHPRNAKRIAAGLPPINALWFWGAGALPATVLTLHATVLSDDELLHSLAHVAKVHWEDLPGHWTPLPDSTLVDLRSTRELASVTRDWIAPALDGIRSGAIASMRLDLGDGSGFYLAASQRWRFWRPAMASLEPAPSKIPDASP
jgi:hypothetical protein